MSLQFSIVSPANRREQLSRMLALFQIKVDNATYLQYEAETATALADVNARVEALEAQIREVQRLIIDLSFKLGL